MMTTDHRMTGSGQSLPRSGHSRRSGISLILSAALTVALGATLIAAPANSATPTAVTPRTADSTVTAGTFNVNKGTLVLGKGPDRMRRIADEIRRGAFDVIGLQEIATELRGYVAPRLRPMYSYSLAGDAKGRNITGSQIFYRPDVLYPGRTQGIITLPTPSGDIPRSALYQDFYHLGSGAHFLFVSTHLSKRSGRAASNVRASQAQSLMSQIAQANGAGLPLIVVGDMNSNHAKKYAYDAPRQVFQASGLAEVFDRSTKIVNGNFDSLNYLTRVPKYGGYRVDQIYVTGQISVHYSETMVRITKKRIKFRKRGKVKRMTVKRYRSPFVSDHNAIRSIVTIPGQ